MFVCLKRKWIIVAVLILVAVAGACGTFFAVKDVGYMPKGECTVVIDAGHGGLDVK